MAPSEIRGILFDSGDTLVRPVAGYWWPGHRFHQLVADRGLGELDWSRMPAAIKQGLEYLENNHLLFAVDEEREQFRAFYEIVLRGLGVQQPHPSLALDIAKANVDENNVLAFPDTHAAVRSLHKKGLRLGILSDTWPSLDQKYRSLGLRKYFDVFVISAHVGVSKPHPKIFEAAVEAMEMSPSDILFVDDSADNVRHANTLGMTGVVMARSGLPPTNDVPCVSNLGEITELFP